MKRPRCVHLALSVVVTSIGLQVSPGWLGAQEDSRDTLRTNLRPVSELVSLLPGTPVTLTSLVDVALRQGFALRLAEATRREAAARMRTAGGAVDPEIQMSSEVTSDPWGAAGGTQHRSVLGLTTAMPWGTRIRAAATRHSALDANGTSAGVSALRSFTSGGVTVVQPLLEGFRQETAEWRASSREDDAAQQQFDRVRDQVATDVALAYWELSETQAIEAVYQRSLELSQGLLRRLGELAKRDLVAEVDVLTVQTGVALREALLNAAQQERRERSDALILLVFGDAAGARLTADSLPLKATDTEPDTLPLPTSDALLTQAMQQRSDLRAATLRLEGADIRWSRAANFQRPGLDLTAGYQSDGALAATGVAGGDGSGRGSWQLGVSLTAPVFNRRDLGQAQAAAVNRDVERLRWRVQRNAVLGEVRAAERRVRMGQERYAIATRAGTLSWAQLQAERRRLELGLGDVFRLLQTEENAVRGQLEAVRARHDLLRAQALLHLATGRVRRDD